MTLRGGLNIEDFPSLPRMEKTTERVPPEAKIFQHLQIKVPVTKIPKRQALNFEAGQAKRGMPTYATLIREGSTALPKKLAFTDLPNEIRVHILSFDSKKTLAAVSRVSKTIHEWAQPVLYASFDTDLDIESPRFTTFLRTMIELPDLAQHMKRLDTSKRASPLTSAGYSRGHAKPLSKDYKTICSAMKSLPMPWNEKKRWSDGLRTEIFQTDKERNFAPRNFKKADSFLTVLLTKLPNLEELRLRLGI